jgi:hypothetical protein
MLGQVQVERKSFSITQRTLAIGGGFWQLYWSPTYAKQLVFVQIACMIEGIVIEKKVKLGNSSFNSEVQMILM